MAEEALGRQRGRGLTRVLGELRGALTALALVICVVLAGASFTIGIPGEALLESLRFHIAAALFIVIVLLFISRAWWRGVIFLIPLIASVGEGANIIYHQQQTRLAAAPSGATPLFRLMSFNLLNTNTNGRQIADYILASGADIVMLMEAAPLAPHRDELLAAYPHYSLCSGRPRCDTVLLSKHPLRNIVTGRLSQVWNERLITAEADVNGTAVQLVLAHMVKPYFDQFAAEETYRLSRVIRALEGPLVIAGDFNATPWSDNIDRLARWETLAPGPAYPATWPVELGPFGIPIDNILTRAPLVIERIEAIPDPMGSNHLGLIAEASLANPG